MAGILAGSIAVPAGIWFGGQIEISLAFIGFWTVFVAMAGLVMARVVDPVTVQQVVGMIIGFNSKMIPFIFFQAINEIINMCKNN